LQIIQFCAEPKVLVGQLLGHNFDLFASFGNLIVYSLVFRVETWKSICKHLSHVRGLTKDFTCKCFDLLDLSWSLGLLFDGEIVSKLVLILLFQEIDQKLAAPEDLGFHDAAQELLIINFLFVELLSIELLLLVDEWQWWNDNLRVLLNEVVPKLHEIDV
jgi:hypothetical protein